MVAAGEDSSRVEVFLGDGRGGVQESPESPLCLAPGAKDIATGDFKGDGADELVIPSDAECRARLLVSKSD